MHRSHYNRTASKAFILIIVVFVLKTLAGCRSKQIEFSYNSIHIDGIDNSDLHPDKHPTDILFRDAVAILLTLSDTQDDYRTTTLTKKINELLAFEPAYAVVDVFPSYIPVPKVESIRIITLYDINSNIRAGDDVTSYFLYDTGNPEELYLPLDEAIDNFNCKKGKNFPIVGSSVLLVLTKSVQNTKAQFEVHVHFENGDEITGTSPLFTIR